MPELKRNWVGRLIDVGGFEGTVTLALQGSDNAVKGVFEAVIDGQHKPIRIRGLATGQQRGSQFALKVAVGQQDSPISITFDGDVFETRRSGAAVCGRYVVSARQPSALMGGVITVRDATAARKPDDLKVRSVVAEVHGRPEAPRSPSRARAGAARGAAASRRKK